MPKNGAGEEKTAWKLMSTLQDIEKNLWTSADQLRANSSLASNEYFLPVMGLIFLRHAYSRYLSVLPAIEESLPKRGGKTRPLTKEDFGSRNAIFLQPEAQFDYLVDLPDSANRAEAIINAMEKIEADYESLQGVLPKSEYQELGNDVLGNVLRILNDPALKSASGDVFGRIYEYFLTKFADQGAHDGGEFFTPMSLVQMIVNVIEPDHGTVFDPACGSGGMFVQSAHFIENKHIAPNKQATFRGQEKNATTIRLAKMNLAVHGLEGQIKKGITYYEDHHELLGKADFVMANPPFNVDEVDADKIKNDPRLPFGLPGVNKKGAVSNGNYLWISYFYAYLNDSGRAGFVMSSQASSAGGEEAKVRKGIVESGAVDVMVAIANDFFLTRSVPCELWFFNRKKRDQLSQKVLMLDARNTFRRNFIRNSKNDFTPEQMKNLTAIVWLYRGENDRFLGLVEEYLQATVDAAQESHDPITYFGDAIDKVIKDLSPDKNVTDAIAVFKADAGAFSEDCKTQANALTKSARDNAGLTKSAEALHSIAETSRDLTKQIDHVYKLVEALLSKANGKRGKANPIKALDAVRRDAIEQLKLVRYMYKQAHWLQHRFPDAELVDVEGLVKLVDKAEIEANDWSLTPGRYVGVAPEEEDEDFDFEETLHNIHVELQSLNEEAGTLAVQIQKNFEGLGI